MFLRNVDTTYESTWRHNPEEQQRHPHRREIPNSHSTRIHSFFFFSFQIFTKFI
jgi:hypothetical protein